jgi:ATP-dependent helicase/nuclease subunit A
MSSSVILELADAGAREAALDTRRSILVQAPAGSGKTELLTTRFLKLLAEVDEPEEILAITFTKAATAEMRHRILRRLERAPAEDGIATAALANSEKRGWRLLDQPQRLNIQTIDSLCLRIAHRMPLAARLGGTLHPVERAAPLYRKAARRTFDRLGGGDAELNSALEALLLLRDSNLANCEALLAEMLASRDQWAQAFPLFGRIEWAEVRARLEAPMKREVQRVLGAAHELLSAAPETTRELLDLADYACQTAPESFAIHALAGSRSLPHPTSTKHWSCIANFLLRKGGEWLLNPDKRHGFPPHGRPEKERRKRLMEDLQQIPGLLEALCEIRKLPPTGYDDQQWKTLRHLFTTLRHAVVELKAVFAEEGAVDFVELGAGALRVLEGDRSEGQQVRHLLVDEFQDTSRRQHELLASLLRDWGDGDGRTLFLVGDPMQSIYLFRQADVDLFETVRQRGLALSARTLPVHPLRLQMNFRSNAGVVDPLNDLFTIVFPYKRKQNAGGVDFLPGVAENRAEPRGAFQIHAGLVQKDSVPVEAAAGAAQPGPLAEAEAAACEEILDIVRQHLPRIERARVHDEEFTVAVLGRVKAHLATVAAALRREAIPFRAVELETLAERQEILDLQSIVRALLHPMDRIAWLALLRAPWCGLDLAELHRLCGVDDRRLGNQSVAGQIEERLHLVSAESRERVERVLAAMRAAGRHRFEQTSFSAWIERAWTGLGGPACVDAAGYENALAYFCMLDEVALDGIEATGEEMQDRLSELFAQPDPAVGERCGVQLMTMHKAKGLGFDVVVLTALHRKAANDKQRLIQYLERTIEGGSELLVAPIGGKGEETSSLYKWVCRQKTDRDAEERKRLLYVACTRAREELHLFGTVTVTQSVQRPRHGSLLATAWPALENAFLQPPAAKILTFPAAASRARMAEGIVDLAAESDKSSLRRLPSKWKPAPLQSNVPEAATKPAGHPETGSLHRESFSAERSRRTLGIVVHRLLEQAATLLQEGTTAADLLDRLPELQARAEGLAWSEGLTGIASQSCATQALAALDSALRDQVGRWILSPHPQASNEVSWTGIFNGEPTNLRIDRCFRAGEAPLSEEGETLWVVDYKTGQPGATDLEEFFESERRHHEGQLAGYGRAMRLAHGPELRLRLALYYPLLRRLLWWEG